MTHRQDGPRQRESSSVRCLEAGNHQSLQHTQMESNALTHERHSSFAFSFLTAMLFQPCQVNSALRELESQLPGDSVTSRLGLRMRKGPGEAGQTGAAQRG